MLIKEQKTLKHLPLVLFPRESVGASQETMLRDLSLLCL